MMMMMMMMMMMIDRVSGQPSSPCRFISEEEPQKAIA